MQEARRFDLLKVTEQETISFESKVDEPLK
jgi:hypothetical protein